MASSILNTTKAALGLSAEYEAFDLQLLMHVNGVLSDLAQLGVGPLTGYRITGPTETWEDFFGLSDVQEDFEGDVAMLLASAMNFMYLKVKMLFDPAQVGYVLTSTEKMILEETWRLTEKAEEVRNAAPIKPTPTLVPYGMIEP